MWVALPVGGLLVVPMIGLFYAATSSFGKAEPDAPGSAALEDGDRGLIAMALGRRVEALLHFESLEAAASHIGSYRRAAISSGRARSLFDLHRVLAEAELKSGRPRRALRELDLAELHVAHSPDALSEAQLDLARGTVLGDLGQFSAAYRHSLRAVERASTVGAVSISRPGLNNVAHLETVLGKHAEAKVSISRVVAALADAGGIELNKRATQLILAVSCGDSTTAEFLEREYGPSAGLAHHAPAQWFNLARAARFLAMGRPSEAAALGNASIDKVQSIRDSSLLARLQTLVAEADFECGHLSSAVARLLEASFGPLADLPEFAASAHRVSGRLAADSPFAAFDHFARAARIFGHIGHLVGRGESLHNAAKLRAAMAGSDRATVPHITTFYAEPPSSFGRVDADATPDSFADAVAQALRATAAMVDLTSRPALSGHELLSLVAASGASTNAVMVAWRGSSHDVLGWIGADEPDTTVLARADECVTFELGSDGAREVSVVVRPRNLGSARTTLLSLQRLAANAASLHKAAVAESERSALWPEPLPEQQLGFVCASESMLELLSATRRVAASNYAVLITGETGTGKELLARAIHNLSPRSKQRFQPFNCTAVAREMLDAQLFGYKRGAFTGAHDSFPGVIRSAAGGTLLLDEIGEIGLDVQPKLLRFLESGEVHPLGEPAPVSVDVRVVAATNANLDALVEQGKFRDDLFYRLNVVRLTIPPLRERREEIPLLLDHFLERAQKECGKSGIRVGETAAEYLLLYAWPGNVRELSNEIRRAVALAEPGAVLMPEHLSAKLAATRRTVPVDQRPPDHSELVVRRDQPLTAAVEHVERALIQDALRRHTSVEDAARSLGLSRKGLYLKRQRLKIDE